MSVLKFRLPNIMAISGRDSGYVLTHSPAHIRSQGERERERGKERVRERKGESKREERRE